MTARTEASQKQLKDDSLRMAQRLKAVVALTENQVCCDCGDHKPTWASIVVPPAGVSKEELSSPMGAFCCFLCSGAHRSLGVHICFVRSITLDEWKEHEVAALECGGNRRINRAFEARIQRKESSKVIERPNPKSSLEVRDKFINAKYRERLFFDARKYQSGDISKLTSCLPEESSNIPTMDRNIFVGMSSGDLFSASKMELITSESSSEKRMTLQNVANPMEAIRDEMVAFGGLSQEGCRRPSPQDIVNLDLRSKQNEEGCVEVHAKESDSDEYHIRLKQDSQRPHKERPLKTSTSRYSASSRSRRSTPSRSPTREGRSSSQRRSRSSHDVTSLENDSTERSDTSRSSHRRSRESKSPGCNADRSSSSSKKTHLRASSSGRPMRRSGSGTLLDEQDDSSKARMRRSSSGHTLDQDGQQAIGMRRIASDLGLEDRRQSRLGFRRSNGGNSIPRTSSGNALTGHSSHRSRPRSDVDPLGGSMHRKGRRSTEKSQMRNEVFENKIFKEPSGSAMLSGAARSIVASKYSMEEYETKSKGTSPQKVLKKDPVRSSSNHGHRERSKGSSISKSPACGDISSRRKASRQNYIPDHEARKSSCVRSTTRGRSMDNSRHSEHRKSRLSRSSETNSEVDGETTSARRCMARRNSGQQHVKTRDECNSGRTRRPLSRQKSLNDIESPNMKSEYSTVATSVSSHANSSALDRSRHGQRGVKPNSGSSRSTSDGAMTETENKVKGEYVSTNNLVGLCHDDDDDDDDDASFEKYRHSSGVTIRPRSARRRNDPLSSKSEHLSVGWTVRGSALTSRRGQVPRRNSLSNMEEEPRNNSLNRASTHGANSRRKQQSSAFAVPPNPDRMMKLFAATTLGSKEDAETDEPLSSSDGHLPVHRSPLSKAARKALENLKEILQ